MHVLIPSLIIILATIYNALPGITGYLNTPISRQFLGTIHHPMDYFYYLSQFFQGRDHWFYSYDLYTGEKLQLVLVGWTNVFAGRIMHLLGIPLVLGYQIVNTVYMAFLMVLAYQFIRRVFPAKPDLPLRIIALIFYCIYSPFPVFSTVKSGSVPLFHSYWFNFAESYTRFGGVPHQILGQIAILLSLLSTTSLLTTKKSNDLLVWYFILSIASILLVSINPVQWVFIGLIIAVTLLWYFIPQIPIRDITRWLRIGFPLIIYTFIGLPMALYVKILFSSHPYSELITWEFHNTTPSNIWTFLLAQGPIFILAVPGIVYMIYIIRKNRIHDRLILLYALMSLFFFFTPFAKHANISNIRILSGIFILIISLIATYALSLLIRSRHLIVKVASALCMGIIVSLSVISLYPQTIQRFTSASTNAYIYLPKTIMEAFTYARDHSNPDDVFLPFWPFDSTFPAFTGRKSFMGHQLLTIDNATKNGEAYKFIDKKMTETQMREFLYKNHITYIFVFTTAMSNQYPFLQRIYQHDVISIYKVL